MKVLWVGSPIQHGESDTEARAVRPGIAPRGAIKDNARERRGTAPIEHTSSIQLQRCPQAAAASPQDKVQDSTSNRIGPMHTIACIRLRIQVRLIAGST